MTRHLSEDAQPRDALVQTEAMHELLVRDGLHSQLTEAEQRILELEAELGNPLALWWKQATGQKAPYEAAGQTGDAAE